MGTYQFTVKWTDAVTNTGTVDIEADTYAEAAKMVDELLEQGYLPDVETDSYEFLSEPQACLLGSLDCPNVFVFDKTDTMLKIMPTHEFLLQYAQRVQLETEEQEIELNSVIFAVHEQLHVTKTAWEMSEFLAERIRNMAFNGFDVTKEVRALQQLVG